jgi:hypothetical protein
MFRNCRINSNGEKIGIDTRCYLRRSLTIPSSKAERHAPSPELDLNAVVWGPLPLEQPREPRARICLRKCGGSPLHLALFSFKPVGPCSLIRYLPPVYLP